MQDGLNLLPDKPTPLALLAGVYVSPKPGQRPLRMWIDFAEVRSFIAGGPCGDFKVRFILRNKTECICPFDSLRDAWKMVRAFQQWLRWHRCIEGAPDDRAGANDLAGVYFGNNERLDTEHVWIDFEDVRSIDYFRSLLTTRTEEQQQGAIVKFILRDDVKVDFITSVEGAESIVNRFDRWVLAKHTLPAMPTVLPRPKSVVSEGLSHLGYEGMHEAVRRKKLKAKK